MQQNIPLAVALTVVATVLFALAATIQHYVVGVKTGPKGKGQALSGGQLWSLMRSPRWWLGMGLNAIGAVFALAALMFAPVTVSQPLAILAVPWTVLLASRVGGHAIPRAVWTAVALAVAGTLLFAVIAVLFAADHEEFSDDGLIWGTLVGYAIAGGFALLGARGPARTRCLAWASAGAFIFGLESGIVKALGEYVATRDWRTSAVFWGLSVLLVIGALVATAFMQQGYATGAAETVVGALNVVGPMAAVLFGIAVLGEGANITALAAGGMLLSGAVAVRGVMMLSRFHPDEAASDRGAPG